MDQLKLAELQPVKVEHKDIFNKYLTIQNRISCECNFANLFAWGGKYDFQWLEYQNNLVVFCGLEKEILMPPGKFLYPEQLFTLSQKFIENKLGDGVIYDVPANYLEYFPDINNFYSVEYSEDNDDYIYSTGKLCRLDGKLLRKKRNLIKQFQHSNPEFSCVAINDDNKKDALAMILAANSKFPPSRFIDEETAAIRKTFEFWGQVDIEGVILYANPDTIVGVSIFSRQNHETYDVLFEKANHDFKGAAQMLTRQTACALHGKCKYLNREQDLGIPGIRKAKKSLDPVHLYKRYTITPK